MSVRTGSVVAWLPVALVLALLFPGAASAQQLGRLFSTLEERLMLDEIRREHALGGPVKEEPEAPTPAAAEQEESGPSFAELEETFENLPPVAN